jgi:pimeloyl-ACP methyl ester carboxylesterase
MPVKLTNQKMQAICDELAKGKSLRSVCDGDDKLPHWVTVLQAVQRDDDFHEMYVRARAIGAEVLADEMHDLARQPLPEFQDNKLANAEVQRRRLEVDTLKWTFARMQPRGVRHKQEDVQSASGPVTLIWGQQPASPSAEEQKPAAPVVRLVKGDQTTR